MPAKEVPIGQQQICPVHVEVQSEVADMQARLGKVEGAMAQMSVVVDRQSRQTWAILILIVTTVMGALFSLKVNHETGSASLSNQHRILKMLKDVDAKVEAERTWEGLR